MVWPIVIGALYIIGWFLSYKIGYFRGVKAGINAVWNVQEGIESLGRLKL